MSPAPPLVSVVTPVHNGEPYLAACVESVLAQTYANWEYIIVDNASTDRSLEIAGQYAATEPRIRIVTTSRLLSALANHNHALRQLSPGSKYCKVLHADDSLYPRCVEEMVHVAERFPTVGLVGAYRLVGKEVNLDGLDPGEVFFSGSEICRRTLLGELYVFGSPTSLLIRSDIIRTRDPFYDEHRLWADSQACFEVLKISDFGFVHQVLTFTRRHDAARSSLAHRYKSHVVGSLDLLRTYGPLYLSDEQYRRRLNTLRRKYSRFLVKSALRRRGQDFWAYHRRAIQDLRLPLGWVHIGVGFRDLALDGLTFPFRRLWRALRSS